MKKIILIDASPISGGLSGAARYSYRLLNKIFPIDNDFNFKVLVPKKEKRSIEINEWEKYDNVNFVQMNATNIGPKRQIEFAVSQFRFDLLHSLSSFAPLLASGRLVTTIHDIKNFESSKYLKGKSEIKKWYIKNVIKKSMIMSDHILTVSEYTKSDILNKVNIEPESITVTHIGPGHEKTNTEVNSQISSPYLFFVGTLRPHKNIEGLISAFKYLNKDYEHNDLNLVIAGKDYNDHKKELKEKVESRLRDKVHFVGKVSDEELGVWYQNAKVFVYPSFYEGFGIPPLEAMGYGVPVAVTNQTSVPEIVGEAGTYFDPHEPSEIAKAINKILESPEYRERSIAAGKDRYRQFTWEATAKKTLEVYKSILA